MSIMDRQANLTTKKTIILQIREASLTLRITVFIEFAKFKIKNYRN